MPFVHLASRSPRRRELLDQLRVEFTLVDVEFDETPRAREAPPVYVRRVAEGKALAGWAALGSAVRGPVLGADTAVVVDGAVLGKPRGAVEAGSMLERLSGREHTVLSAVALVAGGEAHTRLSESRVWFRPIAPAEIEAYCATGEPLDKAGAYAIQGRGAAFVSRLEGSYSGVMGLALFETAALLTELGLDPLRPQRGQISTDYK